MSGQRMQSRRSKVLLQILLCVIVLGCAALITYYLILSRKAPPVVPQKDLDPLVAVQTARVEDVPVSVRGLGTVMPKVQIEVVPEVSGKVIWIHPDLVDGGFFQAHEVLVSIDPSDYDLAVERAKAAVERAKVALDLEQAEGAVARAEWEAMNPEAEPPSPLVLRIPQIRRAEAELEAAYADLKKAQLSLERTKVSVPFNGRVLSERVDLGQYLATGQPVATVYGTDAAEIHVPLEDNELRWFDLPSMPETGSPVVQGNPGNKENRGVPAKVITRFAGGSHQWEGRAVRTAGQIDPRSRMVFVVVQVDQPFADRAGRLPLVPGMFVEVQIQGRVLNGVIPVPRSALREGQTVWVVKENRLHIQPVTVERMDRETAYVSLGLEEGDRVVTSALDTVTQGMRVQVREPGTEGVPKSEPGETAPMLEGKGGGR